MRTGTSVAIWITLTILAAFFAIWLGYSDVLSSEGRGVLFVGIMCLSAGFLLGRRSGLREAQETTTDRSARRAAADAASVLQQPHTFRIPHRRD